MATSKTLTPTNVTIQIPEFTDQPDQRVNSNCINKEADAINALNSNLGNKVNTTAIKNNLTTTSSGYVLDARQGKALNDKAVKKSSFTGTCSASGNIKIDNLSHSYYLLSAWIEGTSGAICIPYYYNSTSWGVHCMKDNASHTVLDAGNYTVHYTYVSAS